MSKGIFDQLKEDNDSSVSNNNTFSRKQLENLLEDINSSKRLNNDREFIMWWHGSQEQFEIFQKNWDKAIKNIIDEKSK